MILVPEKELVNKSEEFLRNLKDSLPPLLDVIHKKITIGNVIRSPIGAPYFFIYLPQSIQADGIAIAEIEQSIINFGGKFTMSTPLGNVDAIQVTLALKDVSEFRFKKTKNTYETTNKNNIEIMKKVAIKDFQDLKKEIKNFLKMLCFTDTHYSQIIPEADLNMEYGPVFLKEKAYADYVIAQAEKYKKLNGYVVARVGEIKNVYFKIGFINPLTEEQPLPPEFTVVPTTTKEEAPKPLLVQAPVPLSKEKVETNNNEDPRSGLIALLKANNFKMGPDFSSITLNATKTRASINSIQTKRQEMIEMFTKDGSFDSLGLESPKSIQVNLELFKKLSNISGVESKVPVEKKASKDTSTKNDKSEDKQNRSILSNFLRSNGLKPGIHYERIIPSTKQGFAILKKVPVDGGQREELLAVFKNSNAFECLDFSNEKSITVNLVVLKNSLIGKTKATQSQDKKVVKVKEDKVPKKVEQTIDFSEPLHKLEEISNRLDLMTKKIQFDPATIWDFIKSNFSKDYEFELLVRRKTPEGEISKVISQEELLKIFL
jgi:hypothetical protein